MSGVLLEFSGNFLHRRGEIGGDRHLYLVGLDRQAGNGENQARQQGSKTRFHARES